MTPFKPWGTPPADPNNAACILPFEPNWSTPVQETLAWKMAPMLSQAGNEQRRSLRREPRQSIEFTTLVRPDEMPLLQSILWGWAGGTFAVPLWYGKSTLASQGTAGASAVLLADSPETLFQAGGWALLWSSTRSVEAVPVASITGNTLTLGAALVATWAEGTTLAPLQFMQLQDSQSYTPVTDGVAQVSWVFEQVPGHAPSLEQWAASTWSETFPTGASAAEPRNHFFAFPHNWAGSPQVTVVTQANVFDPGLSVLSRRRSVDRPTPSWAVDTVLDSRASTAALRKFLAAHAGSAVGFWAPSPVSDITLTADITSATLAVVDNGQAAMPSVLRTGVAIEVDTPEVVGEWQTFDYTGAVQGATAPPGADRVEVQAWGGGGGAVAPVNPGSKPGGAPSDTRIYHAVRGGAGGYSSGTYPVAGSASLNIYVGAGGDTTTAGEMTPIAIGGKGGRGSAVAQAGAPLLVAGGGGGGGTYTQDTYAGISDHSTATGLGGAVGGAAGMPGQYRTAPPLWGGQGGSPGPAGAAGLAGYGTGTAGEAGPGTPSSQGWGSVTPPVGESGNGGAGGGGGGYGGGGAGGYAAGGNGGGGGASLGQLVGSVTWDLGDGQPGSPGTAWHIYEGASTSPTTTVLNGSDGRVRLRFISGGRKQIRELVEGVGATSTVLAREPLHADLEGVLRAGWATYARLAVDAITIEHLTDRVATCRLPVVALNYTA